MARCYTKSLESYMTELKLIQWPVQPSGALSRDCPQRHQGMHGSLADCLANRPHTSTFARILLLMLDEEQTLPSDGVLQRLKDANVPDGYKICNVFVAKVTLTLSFGLQGHK